MATDTFDTFFPIACAQHGTSYVEARDMILTLEAKEKVQALAKLKVAAADPADWRKQITAETISGWLLHKPTYVKCAIYVRGDMPGRQPLGGYTSARRAEAIASLGPTVTPRVLEMVWKTREYRKDSERDTLFGGLVLLDDRRAVMPMVALIEEGSAAPVQLEAVNVLGQIGDVRGLDIVLQVAGDTRTESNVRLSAIRALGGFDDRRATDALVKILKRADLSVDEHVAAADGLCHRADPATREAVVEALSEAENEDLQFSLILALGTIGKRSDIPVLRKTALTGSREIKDYASDAIEDIEMRDRHPQP